MIRKATREDLPRIFEIRGSVRENRLLDPGRVTVADCEWFLDRAAIWVYVENDVVQGFSAGDPRDGTIFALFVAPGSEGRGIGRSLLPIACDTLREAGHTVAKLETDAGTRAETFYRRNGWHEIGRKDDGQIVFQRTLVQTG